MPAKSKAQQHLFQAAEHGAKFPMAEKIRQGMTYEQIRDFTVGSEKGKPQHVPHPAKNLGKHLKYGPHTEIVTSHHRGAKK